MIRSRIAGEWGCGYSAMRSPTRSRSPRRVGGMNSMISKVRRLSHDSRAPGMATSDADGGSRRRKRAWRQPREAAGYSSSAEPLPVEHAEPVPTGLVDAATTSTASKSATGRGSGDDKKRQVRAVGRGTAAASKRAGRREEKKEQQKPPADGKGRTDAAEIVGGEAVGLESVGEVVATTASERIGARAEKITEIDGSVMEGGGQILRNAAALSCLLGRPICVRRVRAGRSKPGLRPQHLAGLHLIGQLCDGKLTGDSVNSTEVELCPGSVRNGDYSADTQTAGSTCLLMQVALPCLLFAPLGSSSSLTLRGGTNADMAPPIDYMINVLKPTAAKFGVDFDCQLKKRGFYPRGGGEIVVKPHPLHHLTPVDITEPGHVISVSVSAYMAGALPGKIVHQLAQSARQLVEKQLPGVAVAVNKVHETSASAYGNGSGIIVIAETSTGCLFGGSAIGKKDDPPYKTGRAAADEMLRAVKEGGCVDEHMQDQLIILMALAKGRSVVRTGAITLHTKTAIHIARTLTPAVFNIRKLEGGAHLIECDGMGLENASS